MTTTLVQDSQPSGKEAWTLKTVSPSQKNVLHLNEQEKIQQMCPYAPSPVCNKVSQSLNLKQF